MDHRYDSTTTSSSVTVDDASHGQLRHHLHGCPEIGHITVVETWATRGVRLTWHGGKLQRHLRPSQQQHHHHESSSTSSSHSTVSTSTTSSSSRHQVTQPQAASRSHRSQHSVHSQRHRPLPILYVVQMQQLIRKHPKTATDWTVVTVVRITSTVGCGGSNTASSTTDSRQRRDARRCRSTHTGCLNRRVPLKSPALTDRGKTSEPSHPRPFPTDPSDPTQSPFQVIQQQQTTQFGFNPLILPLIPLQPPPSPPFPLIDDYLPPFLFHSYIWFVFQTPSTSCNVRNVLTMGLLYQARIIAVSPHGICRISSESRSFGLPKGNAVFILLLLLLVWR